MTRWDTLTPRVPAPGRTPDHAASLRALEFDLTPAERADARQAMRELRQKRDAANRAATARELGVVLEKLA
ncbi:hypothetical protein [Luteimonas terrae]|uniref:Uncharacterized protein n=1 Tax=Luteimonas terrae TaxID=1530191 RepID=A0ABU1XXE8_9GAMM|nr:hypothetical protein [Luteimonas terrae]MDR7193373.1 hypothetical protein [Luteimonas terrae]